MFSLASGLRLGVTVRSLFRPQLNLHVPLDDMGIVESIHLTAFHWVVDDLYRRIGCSD